MNKNKLLVGTLSFVLIVGLGTPAFADIDPLTGQVVAKTDSDVSPHSGFRPFVDCDVDSGDIVAYDVSKGQNPAAVSIMLTDLEENGFVVREVNISTQGIPECIVKLAVSALESTLECIKTPYSGAEATLIADWVSDGGALLLLSENVFACDKGYTTPVVEALGATHLGDGVDQVFNAGVDYDPDNPATMWDGVNSWRVSAAREYAVPTEGVVTTFAASGNAAKIAKEFGSGCVVMVGNIDHLRDAFGNNINELDHRKLALNNFLFLNECIEPVVAGELLPLDNTTLFLAGLSNSAAWMIPTLAGLAGAGIIIRHKLHRD